MRRIVELFRMDGRVAIITGGAGYLGLAFGEALSELGARVVVVDRDFDACSERCKRLDAHGNTETLPIAEDLADPGAAVRIVEATLRRFAGIDVLVNNAAFTGTSALEGYSVPFEQQTLAAWEAAMRVNLTATFALAHAAQAALVASGRGSIINVASIYGVVGPTMSLYEGTTMGNPAAYAASKGGLIQLTRHLSTVLAPSVRVNCITPGGIERGQDSDFVERYCARTPLGRMGREEDFKAAAAFLASDASAYMTGHNLTIDGGWTAW